MENSLEPTAALLEETVAALRKQLADQTRRVRLLDTQLHVLERERQKLAALMHHADAGFVVFDAEQRVAWTNGHFMRDFGHGSHPASFHGTGCHQALCGQATPCPGCPLARTLASGKAEHHVMELAMNGESRNIYLSAIPITTMTGEIAEVMVMLQDLSNLEALRRERCAEHDITVVVKTGG